MTRYALRATAVLLFLLSMLTWFHFEILLTWELSIVTTQLGCWFAIATLLVLIALKPWTLAKPPFKPIDTLFIAFAVVALGTFIAPIVTTLEDHPGTVSILKLFSMSESKTPMKRFSFMAANGKTPLNLDYYPPTNAPRNVLTSAVPWVLVIHGGGWINGSSEQLPELNYHLARRGYAVISIDYRLSPAWHWPAPKDDAMNAIQFIREHAKELGLNADNWAILGRSAGAQIAGVVAYKMPTSLRPKGFISFYNPTDLVFGYGVGLEDDILRSRTLLRNFLGGTPEEQKELYESASVMNSVTKESCPTLLIHGLQDTLVWEKHTERLAAVLKLNAIDHKVVMLRFGPHGFDFFFNGPESQASTRAVDDFLARVLPMN